MTREEIVDKLCDMMKETCETDIDLESVSDETTIETLGFDSLSILDLIYDVQQCFDVEFEAEELVNVKTVGELASFLQTKLTR